MADIKGKNKAIYEDFKLWYALPKNERVDVFGAENQTQFAEKYDISANTLSSWTKREDFIKAVQDKRNEWGKAETGNVFAGWRNACIKGNPYAIELWLAYFLGWNKEQIIKNVQEFTEDDLFTLIKTLPENEQKEFYNQITGLLVKARQNRIASETENSDEPKGSVSGKADNVHADTQSGDAVATGNKKSVRGNMEGKNKPGNN